MKKLLLPLLVAAASWNTASAQETPDLPGSPVGFEGYDSMLGYSRFWSYYNPYPSNFIGSREWWEGTSLSGDWWGIRNMIDDSGVELSASYTNNIAGNPVGGRSQGFSYADNTSFGAQFNLGQIIGWHGLHLTVSGLDRNGTNLSSRNIGNQFTVQQVYGAETAVFYALVLEQLLLEDKVGIKLGRFSAGDDFASSPLYWLYMNNGIDGNPQSLPVNTAFSTYPGSVWGARLRVDPSPDWFAMAGLYQATQLNLYRDHGLNWSMNSSDGVLMIAQAGWTPEFNKRPVTESSSNGKSVKDGKSLAEGKSRVTPASAPEMRGLPGNYWFGAYYSPWQFQQFGEAETAGNSYGFYWHADQMVWQEAPGSDQGLTLWSAFVLSPQDNISKLPFQVNSGIVYRGAIPGRNQDITMLGMAYGNFSDDYADTVAATGAGSPSYEVALEAGYRFQITRFAYVQPNLQWIINPGGTGEIPNALVLGAQMNVTF
jgi:porin